LLSLLTVLFLFGSLARLFLVSLLVGPGSAGFFLAGATLGFLLAARLLLLLSPLLLFLTLGPRLDLLLTSARHIVGAAYLLDSGAYFGHGLTSLNEIQGILALEHILLY
jgi:hypothetical protein